MTRTCTFTISAQNVTDQDTNDPPNQMAADHVITFQTEAAPPEPPKPPTVDAGGPYDVIVGGSVVVSATGSQPDGQALTYRWDLDDNGTLRDARSVGHLLRRGSSCAVDPDDRSPGDGPDRPDRHGRDHGHTSPPSMMTSLSTASRVSRTSPTSTRPISGRSSCGSASAATTGSTSSRTATRRLRRIGVAARRRRMRVSPHRPRVRTVSSTTRGPTSTCSSGTSTSRGRTPAGCSSWV